MKSYKLIVAVVIMPLLEVWQSNAEYHLSINPPCIHGSNADVDPQFLCTTAYMPTPNPYCCDATYSSFINQIIVNNLSSSSFNNTAYTNYAFYIDGTLTIDNSISFTNCHFFFTPNAKIQLVNNGVLTMNNCTLQAGCEQMWDGIYADDASQQINLNGCTISDMKSGVQLSKQARINATGNTFKDNYLSIYFNNISGAYNSSIGNCIVLGNTFTDDATKNLLAPYQTQSKSESGIVIFWCNEVQIGELNINSPSSNLFENIYNGITVITSNNKYNAHQPILYNNRFNNIHNDAIGSNVNIQNENLLNNIYKTSRGAAIYATDWSLTKQPLTDIHYLKIDNLITTNPNDYLFTNCDKGIVTKKMGAEVKNTTMQDVPFGILNSEADGQKYWIGDIIGNNSTAAKNGNAITNALIGIQVLGNASHVKIGNNIVKTIYNFLPTTQTTVYPKGIEMINYNNPSMIEDISQNEVHFYAGYGAGITVSNGSPALKLEHNLVNMYNSQKTLK